MKMSLRSSGPDKLQLIEDNLKAAAFLPLRDQRLRTPSNRGCHWQHEIRKAAQGNS